MTATLTPLGPQTLRAMGIPAPWSYGLSDKVRFGEIDVLGHVNNTVYLRWFENLRVTYFNDYGLTDYSREFPRIVVKSVSLQFLAEVKLGAAYTLTARTAAMRTNSFTMHYGVYVDGQLTTTGDAVVVLLHPDGTKRPIPDTLRQAFITRDGTPEG